MRVLAVQKADSLATQGEQARHPRLGLLSGRLSRTVLAEFWGSTRLAGFVLGLRRWAGAVRHRCQVAVHGLQQQRMASSVPALRTMPSPLKHAPGANHIAAWRTIRPCSPALARYRYLWPSSSTPRSYSHRPYRYAWPVPVEERATCRPNACMYLDSCGHKYRDLQQPHPQPNHILCILDSRASFDFFILLALYFISTSPPHLHCDLACEELDHVARGAVTNLSAATLFSFVMHL